MKQALSSSDVARASVSFTILLGSLTAFDPLSIDMYLPAFPNIGRDLSASSAQVELSLSSFFIGLAMGQLIYGPLSDRYGRKKPLLVGMSVYFVSCFACAYSHSIHMLIFFRVLQALGGCSGMVIARAIVRDVFEKQRAAQIFSLLMLVMGVAPVLGPLVGGYVVKYFGWRAIFEVLGTLSLISSICSLLFLPETHPASRERPSIVSSLRASVVILRDKEFLGYALTGGTVMAGMFSYIAGSPFVFINLFGVRQERFGWIFGLNAAGITVASQINRALLKRFHVRICDWPVCCVAPQSFHDRLSDPTFSVYHHNRVYGSEHQRRSAGASGTTRGHGFLPGGKHAVVHRLPGFVFGERAPQWHVRTHDGNDSREWTIGLPDLPNWSPKAEVHGPRRSQRIRHRFERMKKAHAVPVAGGAGLAAG
jgi:Bcr/CflA subfamily drug resistance transporter